MHEITVIAYIWIMGNGVFGMALWLDMAKVSPAICNNDPKKRKEKEYFKQNNFTSNRNEQLQIPTHKLYSIQ